MAFRSAWSRGIDETAGTADRLVIDAPAAMRHKAVEELIAIADIVVIPVLPGAFDEDASAYFLKKLGEVKAVRKHKRVVAVVGNRLRANTRASIHLDRFFEGLGFPVITRLRDSQTYPMLAAEGGTVLDSRDRRAREHAADWQPLLRLIGIDS